MKTRIAQIALGLAVAVSVCANQAFADAANFAKQCKIIRTVKPLDFVYKSEISPHISKSDPRASGPTLLCRKVCAEKFPMNFYYSDGAKAAAFGFYAVYHATGKPRAYCASGGAPKCNITQIGKDSKKLGRDGFIYLQTSKSKRVCYKVPPIGRSGSIR